MTSTMMHGTIERTRGSLALNPNRKLAMILRRKNAPTTPIIDPVIANRAPCRRIRRRISRESAPSARRIPISLVRCARA